MTLPICIIQGQCGPLYKTSTVKHMKKFTFVITSFFSEYVYLTLVDMSGSSG